MIDQTLELVEVIEEQQALLVELIKLLPQNAITGELRESIGRVVTRTEKMKAGFVDQATIEDWAKGREAKKRPAVVCLCGSTRFWRTFQEAGLKETMAGRIVLSIGAASGTDDDHFGNLPREEYDRVKAMLDELHLRKIDLADEVLILDTGGYIGESTGRELAYARKLGKRVRFWEAENAPTN